MNKTLTLTWKITEKTQIILDELAEKTGDSWEKVLENSLENYRRQKFLEEANAAFLKLKNNPELWQEELKERELWDHTLLDGLEEDYHE